MADRPWSGCFFPPTKSKIAKKLQERHVGTPIGVILTILKQPPSNRITPPDNGTLDGRSRLLQWHCPDGDPPDAPQHSQPAHPSFRGPPRPPRSPRPTITRQHPRRCRCALGAAYRRTLRHASRKEQALAVNCPRFGSLKHKGKTFPPSRKIETLTTMTAVGVEAAMSTTTTEFGLETLVTSYVAMMTGTPCQIETSATGDVATKIGTPRQIEKLPKTTADGVEAAAISCQQTKMLMTTTEAGDETLATDGIGMMINTHQIKKLTTTTAVGAEMLTTLRQRTKILMTMTKVGIETSVTSGDAMIIGSRSQTKKSTTTMAVGVEATTTSRQQTKTSPTTTEVIVATPVTDDVATTMTVDSSDVEFDANTADNNEDTIDTIDYNPLDEEFRAIDTFVNSLAVAKPSCYRTTKLAKVDPPGGCVDMSTYCTKNAHGLW
jgi:hypothetical protein